MLIYPENEWNIYDEKGVMLPWYTHPSLDWIQNNIPKDLSVLEIGGGNSTIWWRQNSKEVLTIDSDEECADILKCKYSSSLLMNDAIDSLEKKYDVVIVDGGGDRELYIKNAFAKCSHFFIVDNWQQSEVCVYSDEVVSYLYAQTKEQFVFKQSNHKDWKTAIFIKK
jgi:hypothetical protein